MQYLNDIVGVLIVYGYVAVLLLVSEKIIAKKYPLISRKVLHILVGNIAFLLPLFQTREIMVFVAAGPFILFTYLMCPYSPITSMRGKTSQAGHGLGLVYYAITWMILSYIFFDDKVMIAIGILAMSYGDGFASVIGVRYGKRIYTVFSDKKSLEGSVAMVVFSFFLLIIALLYYKIALSLPLIMVLGLISVLVAIVEGITPKGLDNLSVPFASVFLYYLFVTNNMLAVF